MRHLYFNVSKDIIKKDETCDFSNLRNETEVMLHFSFSEDWDGYVKVAGFTKGKNEYAPKVLQGGTTCSLPFEALQGTFLRMRILGKNKTEHRSTKPILINLIEPDKGGNK